MHPVFLRRHLLRDRRGVVAIITALLGMPLVLAVGMSIDYARLDEAQTALQDAVDNAALAGATVYNASTQSSQAQTVATNYFTSAPLPNGMTVGSPTAAAAAGTTNFGGNSYNVTFTASATVAPPFLSAVRGAFTLTATATASNPMATLKLSTGSFASDASDWNSVWMYPVPMVNGQPNYSSIPNQSTFYEIGSNCSKSSSNYSTSSRCYGQTGATVSTSQTVPVVAATQPVAFALENVTDGLSTTSNTAANSYGAQAGHANWFYSANEALSLPPSQYTNYTYQQQFLIFTYNVTTSYPTATSSVTPNCSLIVQQVDPSNPPASPPSSGSCFAVSSSASGTQYAAMTCAAMGGKTYMFWWNDMGGTSDDKDFNDAHYTVSCTVGTGSGTGNTQVVLTK